MADVDQDDRVARLRLIRSQQVGPIAYRHLIARFGSARAALEALPNLAMRSGGKAPRIATVAEAEVEMRAVDKLGARHLFIGESRYPALLAQIENAPPALIVRGDLELLGKPAIAIVGARNASAAACRFARQLAHGLSEEGALVVSGLARGIDTAAHFGSLEGGTAAVIASGIDIAFPPENEQLQEDIARRGLLIAEQPPGREPLARHFPYRNRIIAGLAQATVVVEAAPKSGSLITARLANEFGREVMAVPGYPYDPRAQGCNLLIREGATLIQSAADILEGIRPVGAYVSQERLRFEPIAFEPGASDRATVTALLGHAPVPIDELVRQSGLAVPVVQTVLLELELGGRLARHAGGRISLS